MKCMLNCLNIVKKKQIKFLSSPFCIDSFNLLKKFKLDFIKIPSGEIINLPLLRHIKKFNHNIILSTGMSTEKEVDEAINLLSTGLRSYFNINIPFGYIIFFN